MATQRTVSKANRSAVAAAPTPVLRITAALVAVVVLQVLFALSYIGAFHDPTPHGMRIAVVGTSPSVTNQTVDSLNSTGGSALIAHASATPAEARRQVLDGRAEAAFFYGPKSDELLVASAAGPSQSALLAAQFQKLHPSTQARTLRILDLARLPRADSRGVTPFYLTLVMVFGGYLGVVVLGLVTSPAANHTRGVLRRLAALASYSLISAAAVVLMARFSFGVLAGHELQAIGAAALICFATCTVSLSLQALLGVAGTALVILLFVVVGNPASGGAVTYRFLPDPYRTIGPYLVNGAGVDLVRGLTYFGGRGLVRPLAVLLTWAVVGAVAALMITSRRYERLSAAEVELLPAMAAGL